MAATIVWAGAQYLVKAPDSGALVFGERNTTTDIYYGPYATCVLGALARGVFGTGGRLGWVVTQSKVDRQRFGIGKLTIEWEAGGAYANMPLPIDEWDASPIELYPKIERNKLFQGGGLGLPAITTATLSLAYGCIHGATLKIRTDYRQKLIALPDTWQGDLGLRLVEKLQKGEETYYLAGLKFTWTWYSYTMPSMSLGGFISAPAGPGDVPDGLPAGISWLRLADACQPAGVNGSMFKLTHTFIGGPSGHWDTDLYD